MSKKAFLVSFSPTTRVVVDVEGTEEEILDDSYKWAEIVRTARAHIIENGIEFYLNGDNVDEIKEDTECPYTEEEDEQ